MEPLPAERFEASFHSDTRPRTTIESGLHFGLDLARLQADLPRQLTDREVDLLRIAAVTFAVDRLSRRNLRETGEREIFVSIPVRDYTFWSTDDVGSQVRDCLDFVSGDTWSFEWIPCNDERPDWQLRIDGTDAAAEMGMPCLYSGGLDSFAGLSSLLCRKDVSERNVLAVTVAHRDDIASLADQQLRLIDRELNASVCSVRVPFKMRKPKKITCDDGTRRASEETSQRSRSFLFNAVGGVVAAGFGLDAIASLENGIGAINAPFSADARDWHHTKGCHPGFLRRMASLLGCVCGSEMNLVLPHQWKTKGEVVAELPQSLADAAFETVSCVHFPNRSEKGSGHRSCGICFACLFRRVALHSAGYSDPPERYVVDASDPLHEPRLSKKRKQLNAFLFQIDQLLACRDTGGLPLAIERHLPETQLAVDLFGWNDVTDLYQRYAKEWVGFIGEAAAKGCRWPGSITSARAA